MVEVVQKFRGVAVSVRSAELRPEGTHLLILVFFEHLEGLRRSEIFQVGALLHQFDEHVLELVVLQLHLSASSPGRYVRRDGMEIFKNLRLEFRNANTLV